MAIPERVRSAREPDVPDGVTLTNCQGQRISESSRRRIIIASAGGCDPDGVCCWRMVILGGFVLDQEQPSQR